MHKNSIEIALADRDLSRFHYFSELPPLHFSNPEDEAMRDLAKGGLKL
jgi:hypothetical protein